MGKDSSNSKELKPKDLQELLRAGMDEVRDHWRWFFALGIGLAVLGMIALVYAFAATLVGAAVFGFLLLAGGVGRVVSAFAAPKWDGFLVSLLVGILYAVAGVLVLDKPALAAEGLTLLLAVMFMVLGTFRITSALHLKFHHWGATVFSGIVSVLLGLLIWAEWPASSLFVIGLFIGIELFCDGLATAAFALTVKRLPESKKK